MTSSTHRLRRTSAAAAILLSAAVACSPADGSASVAVPSPDAEVAGYCKALHKELPEKVIEDVPRRDASPESPYTAAWGDPAIVLRCGIERPAEAIDPDNNAVEVNGVGWVVDDRGDDGIRFISRYREAYVELLVPASYQADAGILVEFAKPVEKSIPKTIDD
ncbi:DUF3515 domain-containing protein [Streptomyces sp. NBC_00237]|uniref:DUF3515 domain-containing protein n=1 Tax=Streptomyces sp. NBC_00237 TaxID=2975687 RepID=UPI002254D807|nr:DUF3515 domain-containing protein [Streptomyces sp. NBC_00237]MCX5203970.1 DUF3515 domain-containing protein [Streptomyces sp. NBC_00237]